MTAPTATDLFSGAGVKAGSICSGVGWVSDLLGRRAGLRACGNGVVTAQAAAAIRHLLPLLAGSTR